ncbi:MAG: hypothetical protein IJW65_04465 [Clostridia bacterium]|nr:hypothetical protein [Clostridia bacterium]
MSRGISKRTKKLTLGAMLAAIGAVLLLLGSLFQVIDLSMAAIASFVCIIAVIELGSRWAWMIYAVVGLISVLLRPTSFAPWVYVAFLGYYPIIKEKIERLNKYVAWALKMLSFNAALIICCAVAYFFFTPEAPESIFDFFNTLLGLPSAGTAVAAALYVFVNFVFIVYDIALTRLISLYIFRLRDRLKFLNVNK